MAIGSIMQIGQFILNNDMPMNSIYYFFIALLATKSGVADCTSKQAESFVDMFKGGHGALTWSAAVSTMNDSVAITSSRCHPVPWHPDHRPGFP